MIKEEVDNTTSSYFKEGYMYAVKVGRKTGVFETWEECKKYVDKYPGAEFRKVKSMDEGFAYIRGERSIIKNGVYVDGSYLEKNDSYGYSVVVSDNKIVYREYGAVPYEYRGSRSVGAELYATIRALNVLIRLKGKINPVIYYDYQGIYGFLNGWKPKSVISELYTTTANRLLKFAGKVVFEKVDSHSDNQYNNVADTLARQGCMLEIGKSSIITNVSI